MSDIAAMAIPAAMVGAFLFYIIHYLGFWRSKPRIVCLCGSTKFKQAYRDAEKRLALEGVIVLSVGLFGHADAEPLTPQQKQRLDRLHKRKIDRSEEILVLNVGGYIGDSTRSEIQYATIMGKHVAYLNPRKGGGE